MLTMMVPECSAAGPTAGSARPKLRAALITESCSRPEGCFRVRARADRGSAEGIDAAARDGHSGHGIDPDDAAARTIQLQVPETPHLVAVDYYSVNRILTP